MLGTTVVLFFIVSCETIIFFRSKPDIKMEPSSGRPVDYQVQKDAADGALFHYFTHLQKQRLELGTNRQRISSIGAFCSMAWIYTAVPNKQLRPWASMFRRSLWCLPVIVLLHGCCIEQLNYKSISVLTLCNSVQSTKSIYHTVRCVSMLISLSLYNSSHFLLKVGTFSFCFLVTFCNFLVGQQ